MQNTGLPIQQVFLHDSTTGKTMSLDLHYVYLDDEIDKNLEQAGILVDLKQDGSIKQIHSSRSDIKIQGYEFNAHKDKSGLERTLHINGVFSGTQPESLIAIPSQETESLVKEFTTRNDVLRSLIYDESSSQIFSFNPADLEIEPIPHTLTEPPTFLPEDLFEEELEQQHQLQQQQELLKNKQQEHDNEQKQIRTSPSVTANTSSNDLSTVVQQILTAQNDEDTDIFNFDKQNLAPLGKNASYKNIMKLRMPPPFTRSDSNRSTDYDSGNESMSGNSTPASPLLSPRLSPYKSQRRPSQGYLPSVQDPTTPKSAYLLQNKTATNQNSTINNTGTGSAQNNTVDLTNLDLQNQFKSQIDNIIQSTMNRFKLQMDELANQYLKNIFSVQPQH